MNNTVSSPGSKPANQGANKRKRQRRGVGCAITFLLLVVALLFAVLIWGPNVINQFVNPTNAALVQGDHSSHEQLLMRRQKEIAQLDSYGWVDQKAGVAHIPIERAMALVAATGLPVGEEQAASATTTPEASAAAPVDLANVNYQDNVLPIFQQHCAECHGDEKTEEGLKLTSYRSAINGSQNGPVIEPGDPDSSYLVKMVVSGKMPKKGPKLSQAEIDTIIAWIKAGAPEHGTATAQSASTPAATSAAATPGPTTAPVDLANVSFKANVLPIFEQHCWECHGDKKSEEGLKLTSYRTAINGSQNGTVIEPGAPDKSYLVKMVTSGKMPKKGPKLTKAEIDTIVAWIKAGVQDN